MAISKYKPNTATFSNYKSNYQQKLNIFLTEFEDNEECGFIVKELEIWERSLKSNHNQKVQSVQELEYLKQHQNITIVDIRERTRTSCRRVIEFLKNKQFSIENSGTTKNDENRELIGKIKYPFYCKIGSLFAQGLISRENNKITLGYDYKFKNKSFTDVSKLSKHIKENVLKTDKSVRQYISDTLSGNGEKNFYTSKSMITKINEYCKENNIDTTEDFNKAYTKLNNLH